MRVLRILWVIRLGVFAGASCTLVWSQPPIVAGAGYSQPAPIVASPGQLITVYVNIGGAIAATQAKTTPLPSMLAGLSALVTQPGSPLPQSFGIPLLAVFPVNTGCSLNPGAMIPCQVLNAITLQVPYEIGLPSTGSPIAYGVELGVSDTPPDNPPVYKALVMLTVQQDAIHVVHSGDTLTGTNTWNDHSLQAPTRPAAVTHSDGTLVTSDNPARAGETIAIWAVGLGLPSSGTIKTGDPNPDTLLTTSVNVDFDFRSNAGPSMPSSANLGGPHVPATKVPAYFSPGYVGLYQINVTIPRPPVPLQNCAGAFSSNLTINLGGVISYDGAAICVSQ